MLLPSVIVGLVLDYLCLALAMMLASVEAMIATYYFLCS